MSDISDSDSLSEVEELLESEIEDSEEELDEEVEEEEDDSVIESDYLGEEADEVDDEDFDEISMKQKKLPLQTKPNHNKNNKTTKGFVAKQEQPSINIKLRFNPKLLKGAKRAIESEDDEFSEGSLSGSVSASTTPSIRPSDARATKRAKPQILDDEDDEEEVEGTALDRELILTDEEAEYDPQRRPDISKMTERQRAKFLETEKEEQFLELSNEPIKKKIRTEEEQVLRRAELARRRKNLSEKKLEEEKQDTLNRLLKKRASKVRDGKFDEDEDMEKDKKRRPVFQHGGLLRWRNTVGGSIFSVPENL